MSRRDRVDFALLDARQSGTLAPMLRAERDLVLARVAASDGDQAAAASFTAAIGSLRQRGTPYHLAHDLLDYAGHLTRAGDVDAAALAIDEARDIGQQLRCEPLLGRAADMTSHESRVPAWLAFPAPAMSELTGLMAWA